MSPCDFKAWAAARRAQLNLAMDAILPAAGQNPARLHEAMRYACQGGKRLRALLVYAAGEAAGASPAQLDAPAVAVELIHAYSLVHDDLPAMDDDDLRRGQPTVHKAFDEATAILVGDALQTLAFDCLTEGGPATADHTRLQWLRTLTQASGSLGMVGGQAIDLASEQLKLPLAELETLHRLKTGALITASLRMGVQAGEATLALRQAVELYASALGLAYQIQDDVLDVEGTTESLGKTAGKDARAEKSTYVGLLGLEQARDQAAAQFAQARSALSSLGNEASALRALLGHVSHRQH